MAQSYSSNTMAGHGSSERYRIDDLTLDVDAQTLSRAGQEIDLPRLSFDLLVALVRRAPAIVAVDELMDTVWGEVVVSDETVTQRIKLLRDALGSSGTQPRYITTVRTRGYRLVAPVQPLAEPVRKPARTPLWVKLSGGALALLLAVVGATATYWLWPPPSLTRISPPAPVVKSVAVMPFLNLSSEAADEYLGSGIAEEISNTLSRIEGLQVAARTSTAAVAAEGNTIQAVGEKLGVHAVLAGSVRRAGRALRITTQLINVADSYLLWSDTFEGSLDELFSTQDRVATAVAAALELALVSGDEASPGRHVSAAAYDRYLLGRHELGKRTAHSIEAALGYFREAIDLDPGFASAYSAAAYAQLLLSGYGLYGITDLATSPLRLEIMSYFDHEAVMTSVNQAAALATPYIEQALALEPDLAEAHIAVGLIRLHEGRLDDARAALRKALELNPSSAPAHQLYGLALRKHHRYRAALPWLQRAFELDPLAPDNLVDLAATLSFMGEASAAEALYLRLVASEPQSIYAYRELGYHYVRTGQLVAAHATWHDLLEIAPDYMPALYELARIYWLAGDPGSAEQWIVRLQAVRDDSDFGMFIKGGAQTAVALQHRDYDAAAEHVAAMRERLGDLAMLMVYAAFIEAGRGNFAAARQHFDHAAASLKNVPGWPLTTAWFEEGHPVLDGVLQGFVYLATDRKLDGLVKIKQSHDFIQTLWAGGWSVGATAYVAAQIHAIQLRRSKAVSLLERAYSEGWRDHRLALGDPAFATLQDHPGFQALIARMEAEAKGIREQLP